MPLTRYRKQDRIKRRLSLSFLRGGRFDWLVILTVFFLVAFGLLMIYAASAVGAYRDFGDRFYYLREQGQWLVVGLAAMMVMSFFPYKKLYTLALPLLLACMVLLVIVFIPGLGIRAYGAHRWLNFGLFVLQPSELTKLAMVIYLSAWFSKREANRIWSFLLLVGLIVGLVILQPDLGTAILILSICVILYFLSGAPIRSFALLVPIMFGGAGALAVVAPYRMRRLTTFLNSNFDPLGSSYHIRQVLISLGSGGMLGVGLGNSLQKYEYVPEATTDSIFAIIGEELGFVGAVVLILIYALFLLRGFRIASRARDRFGQLLAAGVVSWVGIQLLINLSSMVALLPLTGVPLPFISYGGSSLVVLLMGVGILLNISRSIKTNA